MTGQSCPLPLDAVVLACQRRAAKGRVTPDFRKVLLGWQVPLPGLSTVTRVG
jgi:hypothetical protein